MTTRSKPEMCGECSHCEYGYVPDWGECNFTDENLWNIWDGVSDKCPLPTDKSLTDEEIKNLFCKYSTLYNM